MNEILEGNERIDDLEYKGLKIIQNPDMFCFGTDAVILSWFTTLKKWDKVVDFCTGTGIIPILLSGKDTAKYITGIEIQPYMAQMALRSVKLNGLDETISIINGDIMHADDIIKESVDVVTVNPPYEKANSGIEPKEDCHSVARFEKKCTLFGIIDNAAKILKPKGRLYMIHRSARLSEVFVILNKAGIEAKRLQFVQSREGKAPSHFLVEGVKGASAGIIVKPNLIVYKEDGEYTDTLKQIYHLI
ncbi:MAG: tRNA1(Val) (adenine(37)-N6)-methyltransferase [Eubacteriales bacterium]